jgi:hypothetical protein
VRRPTARSARRGLPLALLLLAGLVGCGTTAFGVPSDVSRLARLRSGESTTADVLLALGEPNGRGAARFEPGAPLRDVWFYEFSRQQWGFRSTQVDLQLLLIFVREGRYDGYLWFPGRVALSLR